MNKAAQLILQRVNQARCKSKLKLRLVDLVAAPTEEVKSRHLETKTYAIDDDYLASLRDKKKVPSAASRRSRRDARSVASGVVLRCCGLQTQLCATVALLPALCCWGLGVRQHFVFGCFYMLEVLNMIEPLGSRRNMAEPPVLFSMVSNMLS